MNHLSLVLQPQLSQKSINFSSDTWLWCWRARTMKDNSKHGTRTLRSDTEQEKKVETDGSYPSCRWNFMTNSSQPGVDDVGDLVRSRAGHPSLKLDVATENISQEKKSSSQTDGDKICHLGLSWNSPVFCTEWVASRMSAWLAATQPHREAMGVLKQECLDSSWVSKSVGLIILQFSSCLVLPKIECVPVVNFSR